MSSSICSVGSSSFAAMSMQRPPRPDSSKLAEDLFSKIDTSGKGYIEKSDLESAFQQVSSTSDTSSVDELFTSLDSSGDGKVTQDEMSSSLKSLMEALDSQAQSMRMNDAMGQMGAMGGMPPPPPADDAGFTKDELKSQLSEIGDSDSKRSSLISSVIENFDKADTDGDGKVSFKEAMAFDQSNEVSASDASVGVTAAATTTTEVKLMQQIMQLAQSYGLFGTSDAASSISAIA